MVFSTTAPDVPALLSIELQARAKVLRLAYMAMPDRRWAYALQGLHRQQLVEQITTEAPNVC